MQCRNSNQTIMEIPKKIISNILISKMYCSNTGSSNSFFYSGQRKEKCVLSFFMQKKWPWKQPVPYIKYILGNCCTLRQIEDNLPEEEISNIKILTRAFFLKGDIRKNGFKIFIKMEWNGLKCENSKHQENFSFHADIINLE